MNGYKKLIKSRSLRLKILRLLSWVPDKTMLKLQYRIKFKRKLNLKNPKRFTEKLQWYKLYYKNPLMPKCVDKYDVREYIESLGFSHLLLNCYGVFSSADDIDFSELPNSFVIKDTLGGGGNSVIICPDKNALDIDATKTKVSQWLKARQCKSGGREWPYYSGKKNRIIIEEFLSTDNKLGLIDYKFFCFNGKFEYMYIIGDRNVGVNAKLAIINSKLAKTNVKRTDELWFDGDVTLPENIQEMIDIATKISAPFPHARIDLYNNNGRIVFGEITFFDGSGYMSFDPDEFDFELGDKFDLPYHN